MRGGQAVPRVASCSAPFRPACTRGRATRPLTRPFLPLGWLGASWLVSSLTAPLRAFVVNWWMLKPHRHTEQYWNRLEYPAQSQNRSIGSRRSGTEWRSGAAECQGCRTSRALARNMVCYRNRRNIMRQSLSIK